MRLLDIGSVIIVVIVVSACIAGIVSKHYLGNDNFVEQTAEDVIQQETGVEVDLSPDSVE